MLKLTELLTNNLIHILLKLKHVRWLEDLSKLAMLLMSKDAQIFKMPFNHIQLVFQLMLLTGVDIPQEFSITVEEILITIFCWSDILNHITKLRILGVLHGDKTDL